YSSPLNHHLHITLNLYTLIYQPSCLLQTVLFFFFNDPATTEIYTLSLHDALPIYAPLSFRSLNRHGDPIEYGIARQRFDVLFNRSEEHTSELQSRGHLVCRLLLEKKKKT